MKKLLLLSAAAGFSLMLSVNSFAALNPITVTYYPNVNLVSPPLSTVFPAGSHGTVGYVVSVNSAVSPRNIPLWLHLASANSTSPVLVVNQGTQPSFAPLGCGGFAACVGSSFPLTAGQSCCLNLTLTSNTAGQYSIQPLVQTSPATFSAQAPTPLAITVTMPLQSSLLSRTVRH